MSVLPAGRDVTDFVPGPERDRHGGTEETQEDDIRECFHRKPRLPCGCVELCHMACVGAIVTRAPRLQGGRARLRGRSRREIAFIASPPADLGAVTPIS